LALHIALFGYPRITQDGQVLEVERRRTAALLAFLVLTGQPQGRETLAALFWPDQDASTARAGLRRELSRLAALTGRERLQANRLQAAFVLQPGDRVDVLEFREAAARAAAHPHSGGALCPDCLKAAGQAVELYTAGFLTGFGLPDSPGFDEWQFFEAESLRERLAGALQRLADHYEGAQAYDAALPYARRLLALDPLHEPAQRRLMRLYALDGQQAAALRQYQEAVRLLEAELGAEPEAETQALHQAIRSRQLGPPEQASPRIAAGSTLSPEEFLTPAQQRHNLPVPRRPLVGRQALLEGLVRLLASDPAGRLVTLTGPGGSGKTRLALEAAWEFARRWEGTRGPDMPFQDGLAFIPLAAVSDPAEIIPAIANGVGLTCSAGPEEHRRQLSAFLQPKRMLLVLDNFEQLVEAGSAGLLDELLEAAPGVRLLVTSRMRLNLRLEQLFPVPGLDLEPPTDARADEDAYGAALLFCQCARQVQPGFAPGPQEMQAVMQICRLVGGLPLAIELAAAWVEVLTLEEIAAEIGRSLDFLEGRWQDLPERQRSLRAVIESAWALLSSDEQRVLMAAGVFPAGFNRTALQAVAGAGLKEIQGLASKSWLRSISGGRFLLHELQRQYALEKLQAHPQEHRQASERHALHYAELLEQLGEQMKGAGQVEAFRTAGAEFENMQAAWDWLLQAGRLDVLAGQMLHGLLLYYETRMRLFDLPEMIARACARLEALGWDGAQPVSRRARTILLTAASAFYVDGYSVRLESYGIMISLNREAVARAWESAGSGAELDGLGAWASLLAYLYGRLLDLDAGIRHLQRLAQAGEHGATAWEHARTLAFLGALYEVRLYSAGSPDLRDETRRALDTALGIFEQLGDRREVAATRRLTGNLLLIEGRIPEAVQEWQRARSIFLEVGDWAIAADIHWQIGDAYLRQGGFESALEAYRFMRQAFLEHGDLRRSSYALSKESLETLRYGDTERAVELRRQGMALSESVGDPLGFMWHVWEMGEIYRVLGDADEARRWYERSRLLFAEQNDPIGEGYYQRGMGDLAHMQGDYEAACTHFNTSLELARQVRHDWGAAYALSGLGRAEVALEMFDAGREHLLEGLRTARFCESSGLMLLALARLAALHTALGDPQSAARCAVLAAEHPQTWREIRLQAAGLLEGIRVMPGGEAALQQSRTAPLDLEAYVSAVLNAA